MPQDLRRRRPAYVASRAALLIAVTVTALYTAALARTTTATASTPSASRAATKAAEGHYTPAACNSTENNYLRRDFARCFSMVRTGLNHQITANPNYPPPTALGPADIQ